MRAFGSCGSAVVGVSGLKRTAGAFGGKGLRGTDIARICRGDGQTRRALPAFVSRALAGAVVVLARILIVEDNLDLLHTMSELLSAEHEVMATDHGERALEMATRDRPDLVMLDIQLPGIDGLETGRLIKSAIGPIPVLVLSARAQNGDARIQDTECCDAFLAKPAPLARIRAKVDELLGQPPHA
jgi:CheY-like chemotaxis protein